MTKKIILSALTLLAIPTTSFAQAGRGLGALPENLRKKEDSIAVTLSANFWGDLDYDFDSSRGYEMQSYVLQTPIYGQRRDNFTWGLGLLVEQTQFRERGPNLLKSSDLTELGLGLALLGKEVRQSKWSPALFLQSSVATDFDETSDSFRLTAIGGAFYEQNPNLKWFFGAIYLYQGPETRAFPVAGISWQPAPDWDLTIMGPRVDLTRTLGDDWRFGLFADLYSRTWAVRGAADTTNSLEVFSSRAGLRLDYRFLEKFWVFGETGLSLANSVDVYNRQDKKIFSEDAEEGIFFNLGLKYQF